MRKLDRLWGFLLLFAWILSYPVLAIDPGADYGDDYLYTHDEKFRARIVRRSTVDIEFLSKGQWWPLTTHRAAIRHIAWQESTNEQTITRTLIMTGQTQSLLFVASETLDGFFRLGLKSEQVLGLYLYDFIERSWNLEKTVVGDPIRFASLIYRTNLDLGYNSEEGHDEANYRTVSGTLLTADEVRSIKKEAIWRKYKYLPLVSCHPESTFHAAPTDVYCGSVLPVLIQVFGGL